MFAWELITGNLTRSVVAVSICPSSRNPETNKSHHLHHDKESALWMLGMMRNASV
jgi:hypothetical protein